ncbi:MAG: antitoxin [Acidimicrobiales bacterium]
MRTTLDLDDSVLAELRERRQREGRTLGQVASELLAHALAATAGPLANAPLMWASHPMGARVNLDDGDAVDAALDADR